MKSFILFFLYSCGAHLSIFIHKYTYLSYVGIQIQYIICNEESFEVQAEETHRISQLSSVMWYNPRLSGEAEIRNKKILLRKCNCLLFFYYKLKRKTIFYENNGCCFQFGELHSSYFNIRWLK